MFNTPAIGALFEAPHIAGVPGVALVAHEQAVPEIGPTAALVGAVSLLLFTSVSDSFAGIGVGAPCVSGGLVYRLSSCSTSRATGLASSLLTVKVADAVI